MTAQRPTGPSAGTVLPPGAMEDEEMTRTTDDASARPEPGATEDERAEDAASWPPFPFRSDLSHVTEADALRSGDEATVTMALTVAMGAAAGIAEITPGNAAEVYARVRFLELLGGPLLRDDGGVRFITARDVRRRIGMRVTKGKVLDRQRFVRHVANGWLGEYIGEYDATARPKLRGRMVR
jgi:hypothetical protein